VDAEALSVITTDLTPKPASFLYRWRPRGLGFLRFSNVHPSVRKIQERHPSARRITPTLRSSLGLRGAWAHLHPDTGEAEGTSVGLRRRSCGRSILGSWERPRSSMPLSSKTVPSALVAFRDRGSLHVQGSARGALYQGRYVHSRASQTPSQQIGSAGWRGGGPREPGRDLRWAVRRQHRATPPLVSAFSYRLDLLYLLWVQ
jgi:hypothetical protein